MSREYQEVQNLIRLKRYEEPGNAYFEDFLESFHNRQREELLQHSSRSLLMERVSTWLSGWRNGSKWIYAAGAAYAGLMLAYLAWPGQEAPSQIPSTPASTEIDLSVPAPMKEADFQKKNGQQNPAYQPSEF